MVEDIGPSKHSNGKDCRRINSPLGELLSAIALLLGILGPLLMGVAAVYIMDLASKGGDVVESIFSDHYSAYFIWGGLALSITAIALVFPARSFDRRWSERESRKAADREWFSE
jgi:ABC-type molybdate transport system permease subunit